MTAVVTGAAGFIGRAVVATLLDRGLAVIGIDRKPQPPRPGLARLQADLLANDQAVLGALTSADAVLHLAGWPGVRDEAPDVATRRYRDNVLATALVLAAVPASTPLVVTSSSSVYGGTRDGRPNRETDPLRPRGGYAESKVLVEQLCQSRLEAGGTVAVARPFTVAGEGQRSDMALAMWIEAARAGLPLRLLGSRERTRDVTDVQHAAQALVALAEREVHGVVNIGTGMGHTLAAMIDAVEASLDTEVSTFVDPAPPVEAADTLADTRRLRRLIGWAPQTDLLDVVRRQVAATVPFAAAP